MLNLTRIHLISHLKVLKEKAQEAKDFLRKEGYLNSDFLPINEGKFILWPLNQDTIPFEGSIVKCKGVGHIKQSRDYRLNLTDNIRSLAPRSFDIFGEIAILRLINDLKDYEKEIAEALLLSHKNIKTVCADSGVHGEFRIRNLRIISGKNNFVSVHKENGMRFEADISKVYFSPRLATERERLSSLANEGELVLDAFAGVAPFSISLAKKGSKVLSLDSNPDAEIWALKNFVNNGVSDKQYSYHNSKFEKFDFGLKKFDRIIMNNPTNSLPFLNKAMDLLAEKGMIHMYMISPKDNSFDISNHLNLGYNCKSKKEVHAYSPSSSLFVFDIRKDSV